MHINLTSWWLRQENGNNQNIFKAIRQKEMLRKQENRNKYIDKCKDKYDQTIK